MSGDAHVRKRGVDKRRKKVEEAVEDTVPLLVTAPNSTSDENIHVHKDAHLGGNFCTKIVFFCLFGTLTLLVGLLIIEFQGSGDVESTADSPWSVMLEGWVDEQHDDHGDEEHSIPDHSEEEESENEVGFDSYGVEESDHEDDENEENEVEAEDLESDAKSNEGFGFYKSIYQSIYSEKDTSDDDGRGDSGENNDEADQNGDEEEDDQNGNEEDDQNESEEEDDQNESEEEDSQNEYNDNEPSQELDSDDLFGEKNDDDYYGDNNSEEKNELDSTEEENNKVKLSEEEGQADSNNKFHSKISHQTIDGDEIEDGDDDDDDNYNNEMIKQILARSQEKKLRYETSKERPYETEAEEHIRNVMNGLRKKKLEEEVSQEVFDEELLKESQEEEEAEAESEKDEEEIVQEVIDDDDSQETVGVILKFGVGVALIVVAHVVLIRKWNSWENSSTVESADGVGDKSDVFDAAQIIDRRDSLVDLDSQLPTPSGSENEVEEEETPEESEDEQLRPDNYISRTQYEASATPVDSEVESNAEMTDEEADDNAHDWKTKEIEAQTETEEEEEDEEEEEEEEEEESPPPSPPKPKQEPSNSRRQGGVRSADVDFEQEYYEYSDITNEYDWNIRNELDFAEDEFLNGELGN